MSGSEGFLQYLQYPICINAEESSEVAQDTIQAQTRDQREVVAPIKTSTPASIFANKKSLIQASTDSLIPKHKELSEAQGRKGRLRKKQTQSQLTRVQISVDVFNFRGWKTSQSRVRLQKQKIIQQRKWRKQHPNQIIIPAHLRFQEPHTVRSKSTPARPKDKERVKCKQVKPALRSNSRAEQPLKKAQTKINPSPQSLIVVGKVRSDASKEQEFLKRRVTLQRGRIDLGVATLFQIVEYAHSHKLLSNEIYFEFINQFTEEINTEFVRSLSDHSLNDWDFIAYKITLADHRRIALLLAKLYPGQFLISNPLFLNKKVDEFMKLIYSIPVSEYFNLMAQIDGKSKVAWWKPISIKHHRALAEIYTNTPLTTPVTIADKSLVFKQPNQLSQLKLPFLKINSENALNKVNQQQKLRKLRDIYQKQEQDAVWKGTPKKLRKK